MRSTFSSWLLVSCTLLTSACALEASPAPFTATPVCYASPDGWSARSTLSMQPGAGGERLLGTTELSSGARLIERAELDSMGRLGKAEVHLEQGGSSPPVTVHFDRERGSVEVDSSLTHFAWQVPTDYPWAWAPLLETSTGRPITTPLLARIVLRAVANASPLRWLDL